MPTYRDVDAGLRIETLEAKLAERDAALAARDAELHELRAGLAGSPGGGPAARAHRRIKVIAVAGVLTSALLGAGFVVARAETRRAIAFSNERHNELHDGERKLMRDIDEKTDQLAVCAQQLAATQPPPPSAYFGAPSDRLAIEKALDAAASEAAKCAARGEPTGLARVRMVFDSMQGEVVSASLDPGPLTGAGVSECILAPFRRVHVDAFKGARVTLTKEVTIK